MSPEATPTDRPVTLPLNPMRRAVAIVVLFAMVGPPLGGLAGGLSLALVAVLGGDVGLGQALMEFLPISAVFSLPGIALAYSLGLVPALVCGAIVAWYEGWRGPVHSFSAALLGVGVGAVTYMISEFLGLPNAVYGAIFSIVVCVVPAIILCAIVRFWARNDPVALPASLASSSQPTEVV